MFYPVGVEMEAWNNSLLKFDLYFVHAILHVSASVHVSSFSVSLFSFSTNV